MSGKIETVGELNHLLGEAPHWDEETQSLYYVDAYANFINKYTPSTNKHTQTSLEKHVTFIIPVEGTTDKFIITQGRDLHLITWNGENEPISHSEKIAELVIVPGSNDTQINDGKVDITGRLWTGTAGGLAPNPTDLFSIVIPNKGSLFSVDENKQVKAHDTSISVSNGIAMNEEARKFYYIDSYSAGVYQYDFDVENGTVSNRESIFTFPKHNIPGLPDGMCIDTDGNLWVAVFHGSRVIKIDPRKPETLLETYEFPTKQVTSVAFGGPNLDELYVTTARFPFFGEEFEPPHNGAMYKITGTGAKGFKGNKYKLLL